MFNIYITTLSGDSSVRHGEQTQESKRRNTTDGVDTQKAKRNAVLSQLIVLSDTLKYSADVVEMAENVSH